MPDTYEGDEPVTRDRDNTLTGDLRVLDASLAELGEILGMVWSCLEPVLEPERTRPESGSKEPDSADREPPRSNMARHILDTVDRVELLRRTASEVYERIEL